MTPKIGSKEFGQNLIESGCRLVSVQNFKFLACLELAEKLVVGWVAGCGVWVGGSDQF